MQKLCIECGVPFQGRSDKKFCSDFCRNHYNNKLNSYSNNYVRRINSILRKNRRILENIFLDQKPTIDRNALIWEGFDFRYYTHLTKSGDSDVCYFCYDYGYTLLNKEASVAVMKIPVEK